MKTSIVTPVVALGACVCLLAYQHHRYAAQFERQDRAIALVQTRYENSQTENRQLKIQLQKKTDISAARTSALVIAARYQNLPSPAKRTVAR